MDLDNIPRVTGVFLGSAVAMSLLVQCHFVTPFQLFYAPKPVFMQGQAWRLVTNFLFFGQLSLDFCFHLFFFARYSKMLESGAFHGRTADFVWMLMICCALLLLLAPLSPSPFLSSPFSFTLVYIWSRLNPHIRLSLFGVVTITAPYLPYALVLFSWVLSSSLQSVIGDLLGIAVGHFYYFFAFVWKEEVGSGQKNVLDTPYILKRLIEGRPEPEEPAQAQAAQ